MRIIVGTKQEQIELAGVEWIIMDKLDLEIHVDGVRAVIEEVSEIDEKG